MAVQHFREQKKLMDYVFKEKANAENVPDELIAMIYETIKRSHNFPDYIKEGLRKRVVSALRNRLTLTSYFREISKHFKKENIDFILLKGFVLEEKIYSPALRFFADIDILVMKKDVGRAKRVLEGLKYTDKEDVFPPSYYEKYKQHLVFSKKGRPSLKVEIHTKLLEAYAPFNISPEIFFKKSKCLRVQGIKTRVLCDEHILMHLCLHFIYTHPFYQPIKSAYEITEFINKNNLSWVKLASICESTGTSAIIYHAIAYSQNIFNAKMPENILRQLKSQSSKKMLLALWLLHKVNDSKIFRTALIKWMLKLFLSDSPAKKAKVIKDLFDSLKYPKEYSKRRLIENE